MLFKYVNKSIKVDTRWNIAKINGRKVCERQEIPSGQICFVENNVIGSYGANIL